MAYRQRLLGDSSREAATARVAQVSFSEGGRFGAVGDSERRSVPVFSPRGISYRPCEGDNLLLLQAEGTDVCAGVLDGAEDLREGELRLTSSGGACVWLRANGDVCINGVTITRQGRILPAGDGDVREGI